MIVYVFNSYLYDNYGFARRCRRMIDTVSTHDEIIVLCRSKDKRKVSAYNIPVRHKVKVIEYENPDSLVNSSTRSMFITEIKRNIRLLTIVGKELSGIIKSIENRKSVKLYTVASPLTVPWVAYMIGRIYGIIPELLEMHDLEPELAMHIKKIPENHPMIRLEFWLEKFLSRHFKKIVVTTKTQKNIIIKRTGVSESDVSVIPNAVDDSRKTAFNQERLRTKYTIPRGSFVLSYISAFTLDYSVVGLLEFFRVVPDLTKQIPNLIFLIAGSGDKLIKIKNFALGLNLKNVRVVGHVDAPWEIIAISDAGIIPWKEDAMTRTMLPTKFYEYLAQGKPVIVPDFGEFSLAIQSGKNGYLYHTFLDIEDILIRMKAT